MRSGQARSWVNIHRVWLWFRDRNSLINVNLQSIFYWISLSWSPKKQDCHDANFVATDDDKVGIMTTFVFQRWCFVLLSWWRHQMETFSALLAICAGNSPVPGEFPAQRPVTQSFDVFFDLRLNKRLSKQSWGWWFETLSRPLWCHHNVVIPSVICGFMWAIYPYHSGLSRIWVILASNKLEESVNGEHVFWDALNHRHAILSLKLFYIGTMFWACFCLPMWKKFRCLLNIFLKNANHWFNTHHALDLGHCCF